MKIKDNLNIFTENQKHCYRYLNQLHKLMNSGLEWYDNYFLFSMKRIVVPKYKGTCIKTREQEEGIYDLQFWFKLGNTNVTWHEGFQANVMY